MLMGDTDYLFVVEWGTTVEVEVDVGVPSGSLRLPEVVEARVARREWLYSGEPRCSGVLGEANRHFCERLHSRRLHYVMEIGFAESPRIALINEGGELSVEDEDLMERAEMREIRHSEGLRSKQNTKSSSSW
jgi:hypothetical protein